MTLVEIIAAHIPPATLERVVYDQGIIDPAQRALLFKPTAKPDVIAAKTVEAYGAQASTLAYGLYKQIADSDWQTASLLSEYFGGYNNLEASLFGRVPSLPVEEFLSFGETVKRHVCFIIARKGENAAVARGTGFLVGPDLVLTCRHVLEPFLPEDEIDQTKNRIDIYFDFLYGDHVENFVASLPRARRVGLAKPWHVASCQSIRPDGIEDKDLTDVQSPLVAASLDFVLVRLAEPVGRQPLERGGGVRRGWISLPEDKVARDLQPNDWILIPQHPEGFPLSVGVGRFQAADKTGTRIRYTAGASPGASGAPCFNQAFKLVGIHNAFVGELPQPRANQAIRFDRIAGTVRPPVDLAVNGTAAADQHATRWSVSRDNEPPKVIFGRDALLGWLRASATASPAALRDRIYAAYATQAGAGCSFSGDVLHAEIRDTKIPRAVYGQRGQTLPSSPDDFLVSLLRELDIDIKTVDKMPPRPGPRPGETTLPPIGGEVDKLERWLSDELPGWLAQVIETHVTRKIDARELAKKTADQLRQLNVAVPQEITDQANAPAPVMVRQHQWDYAYIVIDDLRAPGYQGAGQRTEMKREVRALIAALTQGKTEQAMPAGLRRLRWMILGDLPDFLPEANATRDGACVERLDPGKVTAADVQKVWERVSQAYLAVAELSPIVATTMSESVIEFTNELGVPLEKRLATMQTQANIQLKIILRQVAQ